MALETLKSFELHYVKRKCKILYMTPKAVKVVILLNGREEWIPKSVCEFEETKDGISVKIDTWFYEERFLNTGVNWNRLL